MISLQLPEYRRIGEVRRWYLPLPTRVAAVAADEHDSDLDKTIVDDTTAPELPVANGEDVDIDYYRMIAKYIGHGSSWTDNHWNHREEFAPRGSRCNACRWFELRIFRELDVDPNDVSPDTDLTELYQRTNRNDQLGQFVVYKAGMSIVDGEIPYCRYDLISSPHEVVEALTTRRLTDSGPVAFITKPSAMALASAARYDEDLESAYVNRAVS
jgi:hypothetical protein